MRTLNKAGQILAGAYIETHANAKTLEYFKENQSARNAWYAEIEEKARGTDCFGFEIGGYYTKTGNPVIVDFNPENFDEAA